MPSFDAQTHTVEQISKWEENPAFDVVKLDDFRIDWFFSCSSDCIPHKIVNTFALFSFT